MKNDTHVIYETDDWEHAQEVARTHPGVSVVYRSNEAPTPLLHMKLDNGNIVSKWNPEYVEYLQRKHPGISEEEISEIIEQYVKEHEEPQVGRSFR